MRTYAALITELILDERGTAGAWIASSQAAIPRPGQFVLASLNHSAAWQAAGGEPLGRVLFPARIGAGQFLAPLSEPPGATPEGWAPGVRLTLLGPLGKGFDLPERAQRIVLAGLAAPVRLLPLVEAEPEREVALFCDGPLPPLPPAVEAHPLSALPDGLAWADYLALDSPLELLQTLPEKLGIGPAGRPPCPTQVLVRLPMPCAGIGACGACAVSTRSGWKLGCKDGPVFSYEDLLFE